MRRSASTINLLSVAYLLRQLGQVYQSDWKNFALQRPLGLRSRGPLKAKGLAAHGLIGWSAAGHSSSGARKFRGYSRTPRWIQVQVLPRRRPYRCFSQSAQLWRAFGKRLQELWLWLYHHGYLAAQGRAVPPSEALARQLHAVIQALRTLANQFENIKDER